MTKTSFYHALVDVQKSEWVARKAWVVGARAFAYERQAWGNHPACAEEVERIDRRTAFDLGGGVALEGLAQAGDHCVVEEQRPRGSLVEHFDE